ncbi:MAG: hypothetical protein ACNI3A_01520 [Desulfovibrio sp.]|uniref:hypothetical protein n=1 Tax=Desulfovibrio sp. 7SRBS1 TaxID=3378064 RepID=UPI003B3E00D1
MQETKWVDIAKIGTWKDSSGKTVAIDKPVFDRIINSFDESERRVPLVFGHPQNNHPAYGWLSKLQVSGDILQAKLKQVHEDVVRLVEEGNFKNVSISLFPDMSLRHIGLLGAVQPAMSGLKEVSFSNEDGLVYIEFEATGPRSSVERVRAELEKERQKIEVEKAALRKQKDAFNAETDRRKIEGREAKFSKLMDDDRIMPGDKKLIISFAENLGASGATIDFSASGREESVEDAFWHYMANLPRNGLLTEFATPEKYADSQKSEEFEDDLSDII